MKSWFLSVCIYLVGVGKLDLHRLGRGAYRWKIFLVHTNIFYVFAFYRFSDSKKGVRGVEVLKMTLVKPHVGEYEKTVQVYICVSMCMYEKKVNKTSYKSTIISKYLIKNYRCIIK